MYYSWQLLLFQKIQATASTEIVSQISKDTIVAMTCTCTSNRYMVPRHTNIPKELCIFTARQIVALRPLTVHCRYYEKSRTGYRKKGGMSHVSCSTISVQDKITALSDEERPRCQKAFDWLLSTNESAYKDFVNNREIAIANKTKFNF